MGKGAEIHNQENSSDIHLYSPFWIGMSLVPSKSPEWGLAENSGVPWACELVIAIRDRNHLFDRSLSSKATNLSAPLHRGGLVFFSNGNVQLPRVLGESQFQGFFFKFSVFEFVSPFPLFMTVRSGIFFTSLKEVRSQTEKDPMVYPPVKFSLRSGSWAGPEGPPRRNRAETISG